MQLVVNNDYTEDFPTQRISTAEMNENRGDSKKKKTNKFVVFIKKHKILSSIVGLFLLFAISLGGTIGIANATRPKEVEIPNLVGKTVDEVKQILKDNKLNYVEEEPQYNVQHEAGLIVSQKPAYVQGKKMKENTDVKVVVSLGTEKTRVPVLKGLTKEEAEKAARDAKINLEIIEEISKTVEAGVIIKQETAPETEVNAGDTVKVYLSIGTGIEQVAVTSVLYKDEATAKQILEGLGLVVEVEYVKEESENNGTVLKQNIESGETVDKGSTIKITVNKLAETKTGTVIVDVKSFTEFEEGKTKTEIDEETGEEVEVEIKPEDIEVKIVVDGKPKSQKVKENVTDAKFEITGKGIVTIQLWIDGEWIKDSDMNFESTQELTIKK